MNTRRLTILANFLDKVVPPSKFSMGIWAENEFKPNAAKSRFRCQTAACIAGWAAAIPSFRKAGFILKPDNFWENDTYLKPVYAGGTGAVAFAKFFDLPYDLANQITQGDFQTPKQAAKALRKIIKGKASKL